MIKAFGQGDQKTFKCLVLAAALPAAEIEGLNLHELKRRLTLIDRNWQQLMFSQGVSGLSAHPMGSDRILGPQNDDDAGSGDRFLNLGIVSITFLDVASVHPNCEPLLRQRCRQRPNGGNVSAGIADKNFMHGKLPMRRTSSKCLPQGKRVRGTLRDYD